MVDNVLDTLHIKKKDLISRVQWGDHISAITLWSACYFSKKTCSLGKTCTLQPSFSSWWTFPRYATISTCSNELILNRPSTLSEETVEENTVAVKVQLQSDDNNGSPSQIEDMILLSFHFVTRNPTFETSGV